MPTTSNLDLRLYRPGDEAAIVGLFNRVFERLDPGFRPRGVAEWRRLFADNPDGHRIALALEADGRVVAQYAGLGRRVRIGEREVAASVAVDSMADPGLRRGLARRGPFVRAGELFAASFGGEADTRDAFMWGLPERAAWRIGRRYLGYETVCNVKWLELDARVVEPELPAGLQVVEATDFPAALDGLFEAAAPDHGALSLRDAARLRWRFGADERVRIAMARGPAGVAGYAVARPGELDGHRGLIVCDWLVPAGQTEAARALRSWVVRATRRLGHAHALCAFPEVSAEWLDFQRAGWRVRPSRFRLVARCYRPELSVDWLRRHWYWTLADTDLV